jgi:RNA polymerase sigma-70 factor (ECF subfamily)
MQAPQEPDTALVSRARAGDTRALGALYERHSPRVEQVVRKYVWNDDHADLVHDTFVKAIEHLPAAREDTDFRNWIGRIAERTALDFIRSHHFQRSRTAGLPSDDGYEAGGLLASRLAYEPDPDPGPEQRALATERAALAAELLARLRPFEREMILLTAEGAQMGEIARRQVRPVTTVKPALFRTRAALAQMIGADPERYGPLDAERATRALESKLSAISRQRRPTAQPTSLSEGDS